MKKIPIKKPLFSWTIVLFAIVLNLSLTYIVILATEYETSSIAFPVIVMLVTIASLVLYIIGRHKKLSYLVTSTALYLIALTLHIVNGATGTEENRTILFALGLPVMLINLSLIIVSLALKMRPKSLQDNIDSIDTDNIDPDTLQKYYNLYISGAISQEEYEKIKNSLLNK